MRAYIGAESTLDAVLSIPYRNVDCDTALLVCSSTGRSSAVCINACYGYRNGIAFLSVDLDLNVVYEINNILSCAGSVYDIVLFAFSLAPGLGNVVLPS